MISIELNNEHDVVVDQQLFDCLNPDHPSSFFLFAGAGSGKTRSLVNVLDRFRKEYGHRYRLRRQQVAIITYTNAACDEIVHRLEYDPIFSVTTIHSFSWELISHLTYDIKNWLICNLDNELLELNLAQSKSRDLTNKTSLERARKIESKLRRKQMLPHISKFVYNPNGDNLTTDSLNHSEVIAITSDFIMHKSLMQDIVSSRFPVILVDESQDTKKELIDALFALQINKSKTFSLGLFGDTMQRIYSDGKEQLNSNLPVGWKTPVKLMNHRSNKRIIKLVNTIRRDVDTQVQTPRLEKPDGIARIFIVGRNADKAETEKLVALKMAEICGDPLWKLDGENKVMVLILEHHMAARRMGFFELFEPLYGQEKLRTGLLDGTLPTMSFFTKMVLPLVVAHRRGNQFEIAQIVKKYSSLMNKKDLAKSSEQANNIRAANIAYRSLCDLWEGEKDPSLSAILKEVSDSGLFPVPEMLYPLVGKYLGTYEDSQESEKHDDLLKAWEQAIAYPFSQIENYNLYLSDKSGFGTHQGVKGLEFDRVMVIIDDDEARGFMFSYDKLFGARNLSTSDQKNFQEGKETGIDRTRRLFYVACSRAKESLAIVAYTDDPEKVRKNVIDYSWFDAVEVHMINE